MLRSLVLRTLATALAAAPLAAQAVQFTPGLLAGGPAIEAPTSLQFGPDGRLYVAERFGKLHVLTLVRSGLAQYQIVASETIHAVHSSPNRDDDGQLNSGVQGRQVTGLLVAGTASNPVVYVTSSDPRVAVGADSGLDTNSGILHRLSFTGGSWQLLDLVRGLPRCEENHGPNGMALDAARGELYIGQGGNTNMGAPSTNFGLLPEYAYSAAILRVDLDALGDSTYDLPTLDDPARANSGAGDLNDPFGGNDGANQARLEPGGPVQVWAPGYRNPYDVLIHSSGRVFTVDNGANQGWGATPIGCSNSPNNAVLGSVNDTLHVAGWVGAGAGSYGGHPNPARASRSNTWNGQSPVPAGMENPVECQYRGPASSGALFDWPVSTNGLTEYTATNFGGAMTGDLLVIGFNSGELQRIDLDPSGGAIQQVVTLSSYVGNLPLDVTTQASDGEFPGTIWVACFGENSIRLFEPSDLFPCQGTYDFGIDEDGDGFSNGDEIDSGTDPCSAADHPLDRDGDGLSDAVDPDDDGDGIPDEQDAFAIDAANGLGHPAPFAYGWSPGDPGTGLLGLGFTGLMTDGATNYVDLYDPAQLTAGGAAGKLTLDATTGGSARGPSNGLQAGFQLGLDVSSGSGPFTLHTRLNSPFFSGRTPVEGEVHGLFLGTGDQDHYVELVLAAGGLQLRAEEGGATVSDRRVPAGLEGVGSVDLYLGVDPATGQATARFRLDGGCIVDVGEPLVLQGQVRDRVQGTAALAVGILASHGPAGQPFAATWDLLEATTQGGGEGGSAVLQISPDTTDVDADTLASGSFAITSTAAGRRLASACFDFSSALLPDVVVDPDGAAGDTTGKGFTADFGWAVTGYQSHTLTGSHDDGYDGVHIEFDDFDSGETFRFSLDADPTSIRGSGPPGPANAGRISGVELSGTRVTLVFDDGAVVRGELFASNSSQSYAWARVRPGRPAAPGLAFAATEHPVLEQLGGTAELVVTGEPYANVRLLVVEASLELAGEGHDVDPYEANRAVAVQHVSGTLDAQGRFTTTVTQPADPEHLLLVRGVLVATDGATGDLSRRLTLAFGDAGGVDPGGSGGSGGGVPPVAVDDAVSVPYGAALTYPVLANDSDDTGLDPTSVTLVTAPRHGTAQVDAAGVVSYQHDGQSGTLETLGYTVADLDGNVSAPATLRITLVPPAGGGEPRVVYRVNVGGPALPDPTGELDWSADTAGAPTPWLVNPGDTSTFGVGEPVQLANNVPPGTPEALFHSERWAYGSAPSMRFAFPLSHPTAVEVRLYFGELYYDQPFVRRFDPVVEGFSMRQVDPFLEGRGRLKGYMRSARLRVTDGVLDVSLLQVQEAPNLLGIEVIDLLPQ